MTTTLTIQNSDISLVKALRSVIKLHPQARVKVRNYSDDFNGGANIRHLEELRRLDDEGKLRFVTKTLDELESMAR